MVVWGPGGGHRVSPGSKVAINRICPHIPRSQAADWRLSRTLEGQWGRARPREGSQNLEIIVLGHLVKSSEGQLLGGSGRFWAHFDRKWGGLDAQPIAG